MKEAMWWFALFAMMAAAGCAQDQARTTVSMAQSQPAPRDAPATTQSLFIIERSKNANVVHYDAQITADGRLCPEEPVVAYFVLLAEDGRRKELKWIEKKMAYGFDIRPDPSVNGYIMTMVAAPQRPIIVKQEGNAVRAEMIIDGHPSIINKMYINSSDGLPWPQVHYIELYGKDLQTGEERFEKIMPKQAPLSRLEAKDIHESYAMH
jgi:hypothetical protein